MGMQRDKFINDFNDFLLFGFIFCLCDCVHVYTVYAMDRICCVAMEA